MKIIDQLNKGTLLPRVTILHDSDLLYPLKNTLALRTALLNLLVQQHTLCIANFAFKSTFVPQTTNVTVLDLRRLIASNSEHDRVFRFEHYLKSLNHSLQHVVYIDSIQLESTSAQLQILALIRAHRTCRFILSFSERLEIQCVQSMVAFSVGLKEQLVDMCDLYVECTLGNNHKQFVLCFLRKGDGAHVLRQESTVLLTGTQLEPCTNHTDSLKNATVKTDSKSAGLKRESSLKTSDSSTENISKTNDSSTEKMSKTTDSSTEKMSKTKDSSTEYMSKTNDSNTEYMSKTKDLNTEFMSKMNLETTEIQRIQRANVVLPYLEARRDGGNSGSIHYQLDENDDFDSEDPDEDLDF